MPEQRQQTAGAIERVALIGALLLLAAYGIDGNYEVPDPLHLLAILAAAIGLIATLARTSWASSFAYIAVLLVALRARGIEPDHRGSDVLEATNEAITVLSLHQNPYTHYYLSTYPQGSPFAYPPGELGFYAIVHLFFHDIFRVDLGCGLLIVGIIASLAPFCGFGLATFGMSIVGWSAFLLVHTTDRSNDNAAAALMLAAIATLVWSHHTTKRAAAVTWWLSAVLFGWALAFKEYTAPIVLFTALFLWRENAGRARWWIAAVLATVAAFVLPFLLWNPAAFIQNVGGAVITHREIWGRNVWHDLLGALPLDDAIAPLIPAVTIGAVLAVVVVLWRQPARSLAGALLHGIAVTAVTFLLARWTTSVYYVFLMPVLVTALVLQLGTDYDLSDRQRTGDAAG